MVVVIGDVAGVVVVIDCVAGVALGVSVSPPDAGESSIIAAANQVMRHPRSRVYCARYVITGRGVAL
jgi:hypothetical protein